MPFPYLTVNSAVRMRKRVASRMRGSDFITQPESLFQKRVA